MYIARLLAILALACTSAVASQPAPKYLPLRFSEMAMSADLIVHGEIVVVTKDTFELEVEVILVGALPKTDSETQRISVKRFSNWACASRWHTYQPGQFVVLFLDSPKVDSNVYQIMSAGGEGEMFITYGPTQQLDSNLKPTGPDTRVVSVRGRGTESLDEAKNHRIGHLAHATQPGTLRQATLADLVHAIRELHQCFEIRSSKDDRGVLRRIATSVVTLIVPKSRVDKLKASSKVAALLVADATALLPR